MEVKQQQQQQQLQLLDPVPSRSSNIQIDTSNSKSNRHTRREKRVKARKTAKTTTIPFLSSLLEMITNKDDILLNKVATFTDGNVVICDVETLEQEVLPKYFRKGSTFSSFQRNLHYFGFRKISKKPLVFYNYSLKGNHPREILKLQRRTNIGKEVSHSRIRISQQPPSTFFSSFLLADSVDTPRENTVDLPLNSNRAGSKVGVSNKPPCARLLASRYPENAASKVMHGLPVNSMSLNSDSADCLRRNTDGICRCSGGVGGSANGTGKSGSSTGAHQPIQQARHRTDEGHGKNDDGDNDSGTVVTQPSTLSLKRKNCKVDGDSDGRVRGSKRAAACPMRSLSARWAHKYDRAIQWPGSGKCWNDDSRRDASRVDGTSGIITSTVCGWQLPRSRIGGDGDCSGDRIVRRFTAATRDGDDTGDANDCFTKGVTRKDEEKQRATCNYAISTRMDTRGGRDGDDCTDGNDDVFMNCAFRHLLTAVEIGIGDLGECSRAEHEQRCVDHDGMSKVLSSQDSVVSAEAGSDDGDKRLVSGGGSGDSAGSRSSFPSAGRFLPCLPLELGNSPPFMRDTCTENATSRLGFYERVTTSRRAFQQRNLSSPFHSRQCQAPASRGVGTPFSSPLRRYSFQGDVDVVVKEFGDCLLCDDGAFEGGLSMSGPPSRHESKGNNNHDTNGAGDMKRGQRVDISALERGSYTAVQMCASIGPEKNPRRAIFDTNSRSGLAVRSPTFLPPTPTSLALRSPMSEGVPYILGL